MSQSSENQSEVKVSKVKIDFNSENVSNFLNDNLSFIIDEKDRKKFYLILLKKRNERSEEENKFYSSQVNSTRAEIMLQVGNGIADLYEKTVLSASKKVKDIKTLKSKSVIFSEVFEVIKTDVKLALNFLNCFDEKNFTLINKSYAKNQAYDKLSRLNNNFISILYDNEVIQKIKADYISKKVSFEDMKSFLLSSSEINEDIKKKIKKVTESEENIKKIRKLYNKVKAIDGLTF